MAGSVLVGESVHDAWTGRAVDGEAVLGERLLAVGEAVGGGDECGTVAPVFHPLLVHIDGGAERFVVEVGNHLGVHAGGRGNGEEGSLVNVLGYEVRCKRETVGAYWSSASLTFENVL